MNIFEKCTNGLASLYVVYESPVLMEDRKTMGLSHLLEHMICRSLDDIEEKFDEHGLTYNAYTGAHEVVFFLSGLEEELVKFKDVFVERITSYLPKKEDFEKELPIVLQEYSDSYSESHDATFKNFLSMKFGFIGPIGVRDSLESLDFETVCKFFDDAFSSPTKIIYVGEKEQNFNVAFRLGIQPEKVQHNHLDLTAQIVPSSMPTFIYTDLIEDNEHYYSGLLTMMLGYGLKSPLYQELREKRGLCYSVSAGSQRIGNKLFSIISTSVSEEKVREAGEAMIQVLNDWEKHLTKERFNLILSNRRIAMKKADTNPAASAHSKHLASSDEKFSLIKNIDKLTYEGLMSYFHRTMNPAKIKWDLMTQSDVMKMGD